MKKIFNSLPFVAVLLLLVSCENFMDIHKEYVKNGEIIYAPKTDSISFESGKNRIKVKFWLYNSPNVETVDIFWNNYKDSTIVPVSPSAGLDSMSVVINGLEEGPYNFSVRTTDNFGNKSLYVDGFATSYGDIFQSGLQNRRMKEEVVITETQGEISWFAASEVLIGTEVRYTTKTGETKTILTKGNEFISACPDAKPNTTFEHRSMYLPDATAIDTFYTDWVVSPSKFPTTYIFDKSSWEVVAVSDQDDTNTSSTGVKHIGADILDGKLNTYWQSQWYLKPISPLPHWAVIDMKTTKKIAKLDTYRPYNDKGVLISDSKSVQYYISDSSDPSDASWTKIAEGAFVAGEDRVSLLIPEDVVVEGRYLKILLPDSNTAASKGFTSISEINVLGK